MNGVNIARILAGLRNPELYLKNLRETGMKTGGDGSVFNSNLANNPKPTIQQPQPMQSTGALMNQLQMNQIASMDRAVYVRNLMGLPPTLGEILVLAQSKNSPINTLMMNNINQDLIQTKKLSLNYLMKLRMFCPTPHKTMHRRKLCKI